MIRIALSFLPLIAGCHATYCRQQEKVSSLGQCAIYEGIFGVASRCAAITESGRVVTRNRDPFVIGESVCTIYDTMAPEKGPQG